MNLNPHLHEAVAIFKELGWDKAELSEAPTLPLGTPEQQKVALKGLRSGDWGEYVSAEGEGERWVSAIDVDTKMLGLFATRVGVDLMRALEVLPTYHDQEVVAVIKERGEEFATDFVCAITLVQGTYSDQLLLLRKIAVQIALEMGLDFPRNAKFLDLWVAQHPSKNPDSTHDLPASLFRPTFPTYLTESLAYPSLRLCLTIVEAHKNGWLDRHTTIKHALTCLSHNYWDGERALWAQVFFNNLKITVEDLLPHFDQIIPLVETGDPTMISRFVLPFIPVVDDQQLVSVIRASLCACSARSTVSVLNALIKAPTPSDEAVTALTPHIQKLLSTGHGTTIKKATNLLKHLKQPIPEVQLCQRNYTWINPPQLWELPRFECGVASVEKLVQAVRTLESRSHVDQTRIFDLHFERFLVLAHGLARTDREAARNVLGATPIFNGIGRIWASTPTSRSRIITHAHADLFPARITQLFAFLGEVPCLLSEPSFVDMSISANDLVARLRKYHDANVAALETDLLVALARLNPATITETTANQLEELHVPLMLTSGVTAERSATQVAQDYLTDPIVETQLRSIHHIDEGDVPWVRGPWPQSLSVLTAQFFGPIYATKYHHSMFPHFGNPAFYSLCVGNLWQPDVSVDLDQAARHSTPLPPCAVMYFFECQRPSQGGNAKTRASLHTAWQRGLLHPGVADPIFLPIKNDFRRLKELAVVLDDAAHSGMLSVVWPLLDALIGFSLNQDHLLPGTKQIVNLIEGQVLGSGVSVLFRIHGQFQCLRLGPSRA